MRRLQSLVLSTLLMLCSVPLMSYALPVQAQEHDVVDVVGGPQPGPPLWKVSKGAYELWILPLAILPKDMVWENDEVTAIIATADEAIGPPDISLGVSPALLLNPVNLVRGVQLYNRLRRNPSGASLADGLPEGIRQRYAALKEAPL